MIDARALLSGPPFAHRGLWSPEGPLENSLAAFEAACAAGYGMELDVRLSADGEAMVFHDDTLDRMTADRGLVRDRTAAQLSRIALRNGPERILTFAEALALIAGRTPVLVELKTVVGDEGPLERRVAALLVAYVGPAAVLGFNPAALAEVARADPAILRGLNSSSYVDFSARVVEPDPERALAGLDVARPHFLGLGKDLLGGDRPHSLPIVGWTIRSPAERAAVAGVCDTVMFEGFRA